MHKSFSIKQRLRSFKYAFNGIKLLWQEPNAKLHFIATIIVIIAGLVRHISQQQWIALFGAIGMVWITEAINTSIEKLCDYACGGKYDPIIKTVKDIAAAAVVIAAAVSIVIGIFIFF